MTESERQIDSIWVFIFALYQVTVKCEIDRSINKAKFSSSLYDRCVYDDSNVWILIKISDSDEDFCVKY